MNKTSLISVLLIFSVFVAGCLTPQHYPETVEVPSGDPDNIPSGDEINQYMEFPRIAFSMPPPSAKEQLEKYSDLIVYATVKDMTSEWNTEDGKIPPAIQEKLNAREEELMVEGLMVEGLWTRPYDIHTNMLVTIDLWAKGNSSEEITIVL